MSALVINESPCELFAVECLNPLWPLPIGKCHGSTVYPVRALLNCPHWNMLSSYWSLYGIYRNLRRQKGLYCPSNTFCLKTSPLDFLNWEIRLISFQCQLSSGSSSFSLHCMTTQVTVGRPRGTLMGMYLEKISLEPLILPFESKSGGHLGDSGLA